MSGANYVSLSLAAVLERSLDSTANNIANMSTAGFKASRPLMESLVVGSPGMEISFVQDNGSYLDLGQGGLIKTDNPLDIAVSGLDWLSYESAQGVRAFGRDGRMVLSADGELTTTSGAAVLDAGGGRITLPADIGVKFEIARDGTITDASGNVLGQIGTFSLSDASALSPIGEGLYVLKGGGEFALSENISIAQGFLEQSNVDGTLEVTRLIEIQRAYERAVRAIDQVDQLTQTAIQRISQRV